jgi:hypothetical protein
MPEVLKAFAARQQAEKDAQEAARQIRWHADAVLGRAILQEQDDKGTPQGEIARRIGRTREQVRRYQLAYKEWLKEHNGNEPD